MHLPSSKALLAVVLLTLALSTSRAQSPASSINWETLRPEGEEFTVQIPKGSALESAKVPYHKMELNSRIYLSQTQGGPVFAIVSLSGIKANPALYTEMQRVNSYVDAFKHIFPPKVRKVGATKLTLVGSKSLQGHSGREYRMTVADLSGTVHAFATRKRFYAVVYLNPKKDDAVQEEFLSSFVLPERMPDAPPPPAAEVAQTTTVASGTAPAEKQPSGDTGTTEAPTAVGEPKVEEGESSVGSPTRKRRPISGGVLNGKAISLPKPERPVEAKDASGTVVVQVTVDESGIVTDAKGVSGHPLLIPASVNAALQARFSPTSLMGEPVKVTGVIVFNFVR